MYLRTTKRQNRDGSAVAYFQLAENIYNKQAKRSEVQIIYNFGRADEVDRQVLERLVHSIQRVLNHEAGIDLAARTLPDDIEIEAVFDYGVVTAARSLWEE